MPRDAWYARTSSTVTTRASISSTPAPYAESVPSARQGQGSEPSHGSPITPIAGTSRSAIVWTAATSAGRSEHRGRRREGVGAIVIARIRAGSAAAADRRPPAARVRRARGHPRARPSGCRLRRPATILGRVSETQPELPNRQTPFSDAFKAFIADGWTPYPTELPTRLPASDGRGGPAGPGQRDVPRPAARDPGGRAQDPVQRHRLPVPAALGVRAPDRAGHRPGAGRRAGAGADRRRPRRGALLHPARTAGLGGVLLRRPLRRDVGRTPSVAGGAGRPVRHPLRPAQRARRAPGQERRGDADPHPARGRPGPGRPARPGPRGHRGGDRSRARTPSWPRR